MRRSPLGLESQHHPQQSLGSMRLPEVHQLSERVAQLQRTSSGIYERIRSPGERPVNYNTFFFNTCSARPAGDLIRGSL